MRAQPGSAGDAGKRGARCFCPGVAAGGAGEIPYTQSQKNIQVPKTPMESGS